MPVFYRFCCVLSLLLTPFFLKSQLQDDFSDGDLIADPAWMGDSGDFIVNNDLVLQLHAADAGSSMLYAPVVLPDSALWEFYVRMDFNPSGSNHLLLVLQSDQEALTEGNGYYLYMGETGNDDAIHFFRLDAGDATLLASGSAGAVANEPEVRIRMTRKPGGVWTLYTDYTGGNNLLQEFQVVDASYGGGNVSCGWICTYTSTRTDKFFFDDIRAAPLLPDTEAPSLLSVKVLSDTEINLCFSEALDEFSATEPAHYRVDPDIGPPLEVFWEDVAPSLVHLFLPQPMVNLANYLVAINGVADPAGNEIISQVDSFRYIRIDTASGYDILINEIMADPTPEVALPPVEFIELYNRTGKVFDLEGYRLSSGGDPEVFPAHVLLPGSYVIVCDDSDVGSLSAFGDVVALSGFPSLVNSGDELTLYGPGGEIVHQVSYTQNAYGDVGKEEGGWTLELINPLAPCVGKSNWTASVSLLGGTPGQPNSVLDPAPDQRSPELTRAFATTALPYEILLYFNEGLERMSAESPEHYSIIDGPAVVTATLMPPNDDIVRLLVYEKLETSFIYQVTVSDQVSDCAGNALTGRSVLVALPEPAGPGEIVINEILFDPEVGGVDFVEVYNRSEKVFNTGDLILGNLQEGKDTVVRQIASGRLLYPDSFLVFTPSPSDIKSRYFVKDVRTLVTADLPGFDNESGNVTLFRSSATGAVVIDAFNYHEDFHHPLLDDAEGVSLERLDADGESQDPHNWHSAASTAGYATPGDKNSQFLSIPHEAPNIFSIPEKKLSPDGDGFQDFLVIYYETEQPGYSVQVKIFDTEGHLVKALVNNETLGSAGFFRWGGDTDRGDRARTGIYIVWIMLFHPNGDREIWKQACVVAGKI